MLILRDPLAVEQLAPGRMQALLRQRIVDLSEDEPYDPQRHGFFVVVEVGDSIADVERASGCRLLSNRYSGAHFGDAAFVPDWELLELHPACDNSPACIEIVFVLSDDGYGVVIVVPLCDGIDPQLLALCRAYAST